MTMHRRGFLAAALAGGGALLLPSARAEGPPAVAMWRSEGCGCCLVWADHLRAAGHRVEVMDVADMATLKHRLGVPADLHSCHTALVDGFVVEGHVPAADIARLLTERPALAGYAALGLAVAGMPAGSPGMEMAGYREPYDVVLFGPGGRAVFASH